MKLCKRRRVKLIDLSGATKIWRYLSFDALIATIDNSKLRFTNLEFFADDWEGVANLNDENTFFEQELLNTATGQEIARKFGYASSWTLNPPTYMTMWTSYAECSSWVAIESSFESLIESIELEEDEMVIGKIDYLPIPFPVDEKNIYKLGMRKRSAFSFENEVRLFTVATSKNYQNQIEQIQKYVDFKIGKEAIHRIWLHPFFQPTNEELFRKEIVNRNLNFPISKSLESAIPNQDAKSRNHLSRLRRCTRSTGEVCACQI